MVAGGDLDPDSPLPEKLKRLATLTPTLARMSNLEAAAVLEALRQRLKLRTADLAGLKADLRQAHKVRETKGKGSPKKPTQAETLIELASHGEFFHDCHKAAYVALVEGEAQAIHPMVDGLSPLATAGLFFSRLAWPTRPGLTRCHERPGIGSAVWRPHPPRFCAGGRA